MVNDHEINETIFPGFGMESIWVIFRVTEKSSDFSGKKKGVKNAEEFSCNGK